MNKTKITILLLTCVFLCSCTKNIDSGDLKTDNEIAVFYSDLTEDFDSSVKEMLEKELTANGRTFVAYDCANDVLSQEKQIKDAISKGTDLMIINVADETNDKSALNAVTLARAKDIPIIFFGNDVSDEVISSYNKCVYVSDDKSSAAKLQGEMVGKHLSANFDKADVNKDGKISYIVLETDTNVADSYAAIGECNSILSSHGYPALSAYRADAFSKSEDIGFFDAAKKYVSSMFTGEPETEGETIELIIAENDSLALGAVSALKDSGFNNGDTAMMIPVFGIDAAEQAKAAILDGSMAGTLSPNALETASVIGTVAENYKNGREKFDSICSDAIIGTGKIVVPYSMYDGTVS